MSRMGSYLKTVVQIQAVYAVLITLFGYALVAGGVSLYPAELLLDSPTDLSLINSKFTSGVSSQSQMPLLDLGALIFYSGQLFVDLMVNFLVALPSMITMLLAGFFIIFPADYQVQFYVKLLFGIIAMVIYVIGLVDFLTANRSGSAFS